MAGYAPHALRVQVTMTRDGVPVRIRDERGRFAYTGGAGSQQGIADRNRGLAYQAQRQIGVELKENILRPGVSTGRLLRATMDPQNVHWDRSGFAVGDPNFLDRSSAKYWRTIDQGTSHWRRPFVGSTFYVFKAKAWGGTLAGFNADASYAGAPWRRSRPGARSDMFNPIRQATYEQILNSTYEVGGKEIDGSKLVGTVQIRRDIEAKQYYLRGFRRSGVIDRGVEGYWAEFAKFLP